MTSAGSSGSRPIPGVRIALLAIALAFLVGQNLTWMRRHILQAPPPWDPGLYLFMSLRYWHVLTDHGLLALWREIRDPLLVPYVPPLFPLSALPLYSVFGESRLAAYATSSLYLCAMLLAIALLAREHRGAHAFALALFLGATFSAPIRLSRDYHMDLPAATLLALGVLALLRSEGFRRTGPSLVFGGLAGLALLTKTMSGPFFVAPALFALVQTCRRSGDVPARLRNAGFALAATLLVASAWWQTHSTRAVWYLLYYGFGKGAEPYAAAAAGPLTPANLAFYIKAMANEGASVPYALLMAALLARAAWRLRRGRDPAEAGLASGLLWTWLLAGYVLLTLSRNKEADRYIVFLVPPAAALLAGAVTRLPGRPRNGAIAAIVVMGLANYAALTWPGLRVPLLEWRAPFALVLERPWHAWLRSTTPVPVAGWPMREIVHALSASAAATKARLVPGLLAEPAPEDAAPEALVRTAYRRLLRREPDPVGLETYSRELRAGTRSAAGLLQELASSDEFRERPLRVLVVPDHPFLNSSTLRYYAEAARAPVVFDRVEPGQPPPSLRDWDALVVKEGGYPGPAFSTTYVAWIEERLRESGAGLALLPPPLPCPDGSSVRLFAAAGASGP